MTDLANQDQGIIEAEHPTPGADVQPGNDALTNDTEESAEQDIANEPEIAFRWQASEFVHHNKSMMWYAILIFGVIVLISLSVLLHLWLEIGVFLVGGGAVIVYARKPPRTLLYELSNEGVIIDGKPHSYEEYRSFAVIPDVDWHSIDLEPVKRFSPRTALLFDTQDFEQIVGHLERHLPRQDRELEFIERLARYIRF
jgi:hypothetical protein